MNLESIWRADVQQRIFRELLEAFSRPGAVRDLTPWLDGRTARSGALASLMDGETSLADPHALVAERDWSLFQAERGRAGTARYVVADGRRAPDFDPALGSLESPEFGATLLLEIDRLGEGPVIIDLAGPGVNGRRKLCFTGLHDGWLTHRADWVAGFPLGVDVVLLDPTQVAALPRTTRITLHKEQN